MLGSDTVGLFHGFVSAEQLLIRRRFKKRNIWLSHGSAHLGGAGDNGYLGIHNKAGRQLIYFNGEGASGYFGGGDGFGGPGRRGSIAIRDQEGRNAVELIGDSRVRLLDSKGNATVFFSGKTAQAGLGGGDRSGSLFLRDREGRSTLYFSGATGYARLGGGGHRGSLALSDRAR